MKTLILGLGNDIRGDDAVGIRVGSRVYEKLLEEELFSEEELSCTQAFTAGINLLDEYSGYDTVYILDSLLLKDKEVGECFRVKLGEEDVKSSFISHGIGLQTTLSLGSKLQVDKPDKVVVFGIVVKDPYTFGERMCEELEDALPNIVEEITASIREDLTDKRD